MSRRIARDIAFAVIALPFLAGCPKPADDSLEPNDTADQATPIMAGESISAITVQGNPDVFALNLGPAAVAGRVIQFQFHTVSGSACPALAVSGPDGATLYRDTNRFCGRVGSPPQATEGADLEISATGFVLRIPATAEGAYLLTVEEKGQADNVIDFAWAYELTAELAPP